jgi:uncharacterized repeat protein (TIGR02543 family)
MITNCKDDFMWIRRMFFISLLAIVGSVLLNCEFPSPPPGPEEASIGLILKSANAISTVAITDTIGKNDTIGLVVNLTQHFDSVVITCLNGDIPDPKTRFKYTGKKIEVDTEFYVVSFSSVGIRTITATGYKPGLPNSVVSAKINVVGQLPGVNQMPVLKIPRTRLVIAGETLVLKVSATDPDPGQTVDITAEKKPETATFSGNILTWATTQADAGLDTLVFVGRDNGNPVMADVESVFVTISITQINRPPEWNYELYKFSGRPGTPLSLSLNDKCTDVDNDLLTYTLLDGEPAGDAINGSTWSFTPAPKDTGIHMVYIVAVDPSNESDTMVMELTIGLNVVPDDTLPPSITVVSPAGDSVFTNSSNYNVTLLCTDASGVLSVGGALGASVFTGVAGAANQWTVAVTGLSDGWNTVLFVATDNSTNGNMAYDTLHINSKIANGFTVTFDKNDPAATGTMAPQTIAEGGSAPLTANTFVKTGWSFAGWATSAGGEVAYPDGASYTMGAGNVILYAKWTQGAHTVTFDKNDAAATGTMAAQTIAEGGSAALTVNAFVKTGWTFAGWATSAGGEVAYSDGANYTMGTGDVILYAKWTQSAHTVTFDKNDATATGTMAAQTIAEGSSVPLSANAFVKTGWTFAGWAASAGGEVAYTDGASYTMGAGDVILYAKWTQTAHTVTFDKNDAAATGTMAAQTITEGSSSPLTANAFVKTGWAFAGWAASAGGEVAYTDGASYTMGTADVTLYAKWTQNTHTVTFDKNDAAAVGTMAAQTIAEGSSSPLTANAFVKTGWTFTGWAASAGGEVAYTDGASYAMGTGDVTLYAKWVQKTHTVTFNKNDVAATGSMAAQTIAEGSSAPLTSNAFVKTGWSFAGWMTSATGTMVAFSDGAGYPMGTADVTLYAKWTQNTHTVTFNKNDAAATGTMAKQTIAEGTSAPLTANGFSKTGWKFDGWATSASGTAVYADRDDFPMGSADVTLFAKWSAQSFSITFNKNDAAATGSMSAQTIPSGSSMPLKPNTFSKSGATFAGWATSANGAKVYNDQASYTMGTSNVTLYAKWTANYYKITFNKNNPDAGGGMIQQSIASGSNVKLNTCSFFDNCRTFVGWATTPTGAAQYSDGGNYTMGASDVTLYAKWNDAPITVTLPAGSTADHCRNYPLVCTNNTQCVESYEWHFQAFQGDQIVVCGGDFEGCNTNTLTINAQSGMLVWCILTDYAGRKVTTGTWQIQIVPPYCPE